MGIFRSGVYILDALGQPIHITTSLSSLGPYSILAPLRPSQFASTLGRLPRFTAVRADADRLVMGPWELRTRRARPWSARPKWELLAGRTHRWTAIAAHLHKIMGPSDPRIRADIAHARLVKETSELQTAMVDEDIDRVGRAAGQLAGLGQGLTPAGDDYLCGVLLALHASRQSNWRRLVSNPIRAGVAGRTSSLSLALLDASLHGEASVPWHTLVRGLVNGDPEKARRAASVIGGMGHSSGAWALAGFLETVLRRNQVEGAALPLPPPLTGSRDKVGRGTG